VLLRILTNYIQIMFLLRGLDLSLPQRFLDVYSSIASVQQAQTDIFQVDCFYKDMSFSTSKAVISLLVIAIIPFAFCLLILLFFLLLRLCKPRTFKGTALRNSICATGILAFLLYPTISNSCFEMLSCITVDDKYYLIADVAIECYTREHYLVLLEYVLPVFLVWVVGMPLGIFLILCRKRKTLDDRNTIIKYGLFYIGLTDKMYFWEVIIINIRKILLVSIAVSLKRAQASLQPLTASLILYSNLFLLRYLEPYNSAML